jgi:fucose permease
MKELKIFDNPKNVRRLLRFFYVSLLVLFLSDIFVHYHHGFPWEKYLGFHAVYGFISCVLLIFIAKVLRLIVMRPENYYDS